MIRMGTRRLHPWLAWLFVAAVLVQVFLAVVRDRDGSA